MRSLWMKPSDMKSFRMIQKQQGYSLWPARRKVSHTDKFILHDVKKKTGQNVHQQSDVNKSMH